VEVHLLPLASLLRYPLLGVVAALVTLVALAAVPLARARSLAVSAITGLGIGTVLLAAALFSMASALGVSSLPAMATASRTAITKLVSDTCTRLSSDNCRPCRGARSR
jgi:hypothetical protein